MKCATQTRNKTSYNQRHRHLTFLSTNGIECNREEEKKKTNDEEEEEFDVYFTLNETLCCRFDKIVIVETKMRRKSVSISCRAQKMTFFSLLLSFI